MNFIPHKKLFKTNKSIIIMSIDRPLSGIFELLNWIDVDKLCLLDLSLNYNAIDFLRQYPEKIDWDNLSRNSNPQVIELLKNHVYDSVSTGVESITEMNLGPLKKATCPCCHR